MSPHRCCAHDRDAHKKTDLWKKCLNGSARAPSSGPAAAQPTLAPMPTITDADVIDEDVTPEQLRAMSLDEEQRGMAMQIAMEQQAEELQAVAR